MIKAPIITEVTSRVKEKRNPNWLGVGYVEPSIGIVWVYAGNPYETIGQNSFRPVRFEDIIETE